MAPASKEAASKDGNAVLADTAVLRSAEAATSTDLPSMPAQPVLVPGLAFGSVALRRAMDVGRSDDPVEREADRVADDVVSVLHGGARVARPTQQSPAPQDAASTAAPEIGMAGGTVSAGTQGAILSARNGGTTLPGAVRRQLESALDTDLSGVRVHTGSAVESLAAGISARAFTVGRDVFFRDGLPSINSPAGTHLLAHELAHVAQQNPHPSPRTDRPVPDPLRRSPGSMIRRNGESAKVLQDLTRPQVFQGPDAVLQQVVVDKLEAEIGPLNQKAKAKHAAKLKEIDDWSEKFYRKKHTEEEEAKHRQEKPRRESAIFPAFGENLLYLGSIILTDIPADAAGEKKMIAGAKLVETENAIGKAHGVKLAKVAKVRDDIVRITLETMIRARQIEYLRKSGIVGKKWKIIIEVHYYRDRSDNVPNLHKDTEGETLFVNLNYTNQQPMPGPEFIVNPPLVQAHEDKLKENFPPEFISDLAETRRHAADPTRIETKDLPPYSVVSFVDDAIHHATPLLGHRNVSVSSLKKFLATNSGFSDHYHAAESAYLASIRPAVGLDAGEASFTDLFTARISPGDKAMWKELMALCARDGATTLQRPALTDAGMKQDEIDRLLSQFGDDKFRTVSIPKKARTNPADQGRIPLTPDGKPGRAITLQREMSQRALLKTLPAVPAGPRRFFRTWVRVVPRDA